MQEETSWFPTAARGGDSGTADASSKRGVSPVRIGMVRDLKQRTESRGEGQNTRTEQVMTFRAERYDDNGNRRPPIAIELRGKALWGVVSDGDWVQLSPEWSAAQTVSVEQMMNVTTGALFGVERHRPHYVVYVLVGLAVVGMGTALLGGFTSSSSGDLSPVVAMGVGVFVCAIILAAITGLVTSLRGDRTLGPQRPRTSVGVRFLKVLFAVVALIAGYVIARHLGVSRWFE